HHDFTRIIEMKHATRQATQNTTIIREYPAEYDQENEPYYPVPTAQAHDLHAKYQGLVNAERNVTFVGRLARYRYYNMDECVSAALKTYDRLRNMFPSPYSTPL
ncbi:MAG: UDP-galactopyranose mutase, partial [Puniceicoccales bacterium]